ncbi:hypothetical protein CAL26_22090 [Bordetella genomosp. 9]|uniref:Lipoprotein n=1 Tax=Bordetella genomosp. 9 TaxID=1416803 RepID=A0A261R5K5_9BORD|nr:hypothetical protein [Bordetella genomosp. 9]OZI20231.1 hypothetical protein CAL26_22090 [Bordetella genomosp. 9]
MKTLTLRTAVAALALATAAGVASPAMAHGYGYYHGGWRGSSAGWWVGGALALGAAGAIIAANSRPAVVYTSPVYAAPVYAAPPVVYGAPVYPAPVYAAPPVAYTPPPVYTPPPAPPTSLIAYPARGQNQAQQMRDRGECQGWAMNQSGYDPEHPNQWTTGVMVDSYNRAMSACMTGRGYSVS